MALPKRAMILAAGQGTRMRPLTDDRPKAMVEVAGRMLIDHVLDRLVANGVSTVVVNAHHFADKLIAHLKTRKDAEIIISDERDKLLDTGGGVKKALPHFKGEPFLTHNCDTIWTEGYSNALQRVGALFDPDRMEALLLLASLVRALGFDGRGDFDMTPDGRLTRRAEHYVAAFAFMGVQIVHPRLFADAPDGVYSTNRLWDKAIAAKRLYGLRLDGTWMHVGTPESITEAEAFLKSLGQA